MSSDPLTNLAEAGAAMHELYLTLRESGFAKDEALRIVAYMMIGKPDEPSG